MSSQSQQVIAAVTKYDPSTDIYVAALSALSKAIILQAETEVTAKLETALPLSKVILNCFSLPGFAPVFFAKLAIRAGGWVVGKHVVRREGQSDKEFRKHMGVLNDQETQGNRQTRIGGLVQLYFAVAISQTGQPLPQEFRPTKIWMFFARIMDDPRLLKQTMALHVRSSLPRHGSIMTNISELQVMQSALDVVGASAAEMFGKQWVKLLWAIGNASAQQGVGGSDDLAKTARVRLQQKAEEQLKLLGAMP